MFNDLMVKLNANNFISFAYADDLAIIGFNKCRLLQAIDIVENWAKDNKITINKMKSGVMIHQSRGKTCNSDKGEIRGYPYQKEYKYLGIIKDKNLTLQNQLKAT